jgi:hypothetical protein
LHVDLVEKVVSEEVTVVIEAVVEEEEAADVVAEVDVEAVVAVLPVREVDVEVVVEMRRNPGHPSPSLVVW